MGATKTLQVERGRTNELFQEAELFGCTPEGLVNPRGLWQWPGNDL